MKLLRQVLASAGGVVEGLRGAAGGDGVAEAGAGGLVPVMGFEGSAARLRSSVFAVAGALVVVVQWGGAVPHTALALTRSVLHRSHLHRTGHRGPAPPPSGALASPAPLTLGSLLASQRLRAPLHGELFHPDSDVCGLGSLALQLVALTAAAAPVETHAAGEHQHPPLLRDVQLDTVQLGRAHRVHAVDDLVPVRRPLVALP